MNKIFFKKNDLKKTLQEAVNEITEAVQVTYGPNGRNVLIKNNNSVFATKDGATVAHWAHSENPIKESVMNIVKTIARKTAEDVGDGTTTATILANAIVNSNIQEDNLSVLKEGINKDVKIIEKELEKNKKLIKGYNDIYKVALTSTNNDHQLSNILAEAYDKVGKYGRVSVVKTDLQKDELEFKKGFVFDEGIQSKYFINNNKYQCKLNNVNIILFENKLTDIDKNMENYCDNILRLNQQLPKKDQQSILVLANDFSEEVTAFFTSNLDQIQSCCVKLPYEKNRRKTFIKDLHNIFGDELLCDSALISVEETILTTNKEIDNTEIIKELSDSLNNTALAPVDVELNKSRLAGYTGGFCNIKVGSKSTIETSEKFDRLEDGIGAIKTALNDGVLPGGGLALLKVSLNSDLTYLNKIIQVPFCTIFGYDPIYIDTINEYKDIFWCGLDIKKINKNPKDIKYIDYYENGILDPFKVTIVSLENAISAALLILSTDCAIIND